MADAIGDRSRARPVGSVTGQYGQRSRSHSGALCALAVGIVGLIWVSTLSVEQQLVASPLVVVVVLGAGLVGVLHDWDNELPVFDLGTVTVLVTVLYCAIPLAQFLVGDLQWGLLSDSRLRANNADASAVSLLAWRHVAYLASLVVTYVLVRGKTRIARTQVAGPDQATVIMALTVYVATSVFMFGIEAVYGIDLNPGYKGLVGTTGERFASVPYLLQQVTHNIHGIWQLSKIAVLVLLMKRWREPRWRLLAIAWICTELLHVLLVLGGRGDVALLVLACVLLYHRLIAPMRSSAIAAAGIGLVAALGYGLARDFSVSRSWADLSYYRNMIWTANTEFQYTFGTALDVHVLKQAGVLPPMPWHYYLSDLYLIVPSQLLPFPKADASTLYLAQYGQEGSILMGIVGVSENGGDWIELAIRGVLLGTVMALIHRWYARSAAGYWPTLLYVFLCVWGYYSFRASTFYPLYFVVFYFLPFMLIVRSGRRLLLQLARSPATLSLSSR